MQGHYGYASALTAEKVFNSVRQNMDKYEQNSARATLKRARTTMRRKIPIPRPIMAYFLAARPYNSAFSRSPLILAFRQSEAFSIPAIPNGRQQKIVTKMDMIK